MTQQTMRDAALALMTASGAKGWDRLRLDAEDPEFRQWTYLPGDRPGVCMDEMTPGQLVAVWTLIQAGHGSSGSDLVAAAMEIEQIRREAVSGKRPDGHRYWVRIIGEPSGGEPWGWRLNGHHIGAHVFTDGGQTTLTPHFIGSEPAEVRHGPQAGRRILAAEEDLARALVQSLSPSQRHTAVFSPEPPADILTRADPVADPDLLPAGLPYPTMTSEQQSLCARLVRQYFARAPEAYAAACWAEAAASLDDISFSWAGGTDRGERHYYCIRAAEFLIEYDNQQDGGNHAHSVWRHLRDDFGGDLLRQHYRSAHQHLR